MKKTGAALVLFVSAVLLISSFDASAATDGFYWLYESAAGWDGTDASRTKNPSADYDYTYGDESAVSFSLPWAFPFYGQSYSTANVDTNGNIWFSARELDKVSDLCQRKELIRRLEHLRGALKVLDRYFRAPVILINPKIPPLGSTPSDS